MPKAEVVPPSGFQEPSEPSDIAPGEQPRAQVASAQQENPQLIAHEKGAQASESEKTRRDGGLGGVSWKKYSGKPRL